MGDAYLSSGDEKTIESATFSDTCDYYDECESYMSKKGPTIMINDESQESVLD